MMSGRVSLDAVVMAPFKISVEHSISLVVAEVMSTSVQGMVPLPVFNWAHAGRERRRKKKGRTFILPF